MLRLWLLAALIIAVGASGITAAARREEVQYGRHVSGIGGYVAVGMDSVLRAKDRLVDVAAAVRETAGGHY